MNVPSALLRNTVNKAVCLEHQMGLRISVFIIWIMACRATMYLTYPIFKIWDNDTNLLGK